MSNVIDSLVEMGFSKPKVELAVSRAGVDKNVHDVMDYLLSHDEELEKQLSQNEVSQSDASVSEAPSNSQTQIESTASTDQATSIEPPEVPQVARSIKCEDCGKLFNSQDEVQFHATKSGHSNFSESTEEKKPLSEEEKREQLAKIEAKLKQRRLEREAREKEEALERERNRIKSGKEMLEAKKKHDEIEMKKLVEQRKREKEEEKMARQRVKDQIEQDKLARKAKFGGGQPVEAPLPAPAPVATAPPKPTVHYSEVVLQIRLTDGSSLTEKFGAKEPLSVVRLFVEMHRKDLAGPFNLMVPFPRKVFTEEDYDKPLEILGLAPRATLIVSKS